MSKAWLLWLVPALSFAQDRVALNTISRVEAKGSTIEIACSKKPSFVTFTLASPFRLVVDISEAVFSNVPAEIRVENKVVTAIKTASYGSESAAIARVVIGFEDEVDTDIAINGTTLVVKVPTPPGTTTVAKAEPDNRESERLAKEKEEAQRKLDEAKAKAEADRLAKEEAKRKADEAKAEAERLAKEKAEAERLAKEEAKRQAAEAKAAADKAAKEKAEAERLAKEELKRQAQEAKAAAEKAAKEKAEAERLAKEEAKRQAQEAKAEAERAAKEKAEAERLAKEDAKRRAAEAKAEAERAAKEKAEAERLAKEDAKRQAQEVKAAAERAAKEQELARRAEAERQAAEKEAARRIEAERRAEAERRSVVDARPAPAFKNAVIDFIGFKQERGVGRVTIRTDGPARFGVKEDLDRNVVVVLDNTRIGLPNNERVLDTSFFDTAVALVKPEPAGDKSVNVLVVLKQTVPYRVSQQGNEVTLEFEKPK